MFGIDLVEVVRGQSATTACAIATGLHVIAISFEFALENASSATNRWYERGKRCKREVVVFKDNTVIVAI